MELLDYVKERYNLKYSLSTFDENYKKYLALKPFKASENIFENGQECSEEVHYIMRLCTSWYFRCAFEAMKIDLEDPNLKEDLQSGNLGTPGRLAKVYCGSGTKDSEELGSGRWMQKPRLAVFPNTQGLHLPIFKKVDLVSNCSHHTLPFSTLFKDSYAVVGYIPEGYVLGISKLQRLVNFIARRYWLQEDLTKALFNVISDAAGTRNVYIGLFNIRHSCEFLRGAKTVNGSFTSEYYDGKFKDPEVLKTAREV